MIIFIDLEEEVGKTTFRSLSVSLFLWMEDPLIVSRVLNQKWQKNCRHLNLIFLRKICV